LQNIHNYYCLINTCWCLSLISIPKHAELKTVVLSWVLPNGMSSKEVDGNSLSFSHRLFDCLLVDGCQTCFVRADWNILFV
jgi:hypothetical protein